MKSELAEVANDMVDTNKKYLIWNNKGGVGKTFLTYNLAVEYAIAHSDEDVVVIDACPQSNVSEIIWAAMELEKKILTTSVIEILL